jgi:hypothetical protein
MELARGVVVVVRRGVAWRGHSVSPRQEGRAAIAGTGRATVAGRRLGVAGNSGGWDGNGATAEQTIRSQPAATPRIEA